MVEIHDKTVTICRQQVILLVRLQAASVRSIHHRSRVQAQASATLVQHHVQGAAHLRVVLHVRVDSKEVLPHVLVQ